MFKQLGRLVLKVIECVWAFGAHIVECLLGGWEALRYWDSRISTEVVVANAMRRRRLERKLRAGLRQLQRAFGELAPAKIAVLVQHVVVAERQLAGCCQICQGSDGCRFALVRLALQVDGRSLTADELLAVLAEQYIALAMQSGGPSLLVPIDLEPPAVDSPRHPTALRPDPLAPRNDRSA